MEPLALSLLLVSGQWLTGSVESRGTRIPLSSATITQTDGGVLCETDADGRFDLHLDAGTEVLTIRAAGHAPITVTEVLEPDQHLEVRYRLKRIDHGWETVVRARRDDASRIELSRTELHEAAGTQGDPFRVAMLLPGVASVASGLSYPVVRGSQPAATGFFLDGVKMPQLYHLIAGPAVVHPDFIEKVDFYPGILPARFGRLLGGAIDGQLAKPPPRLHMTASVDVLNAGALVSVPLDAAHLNITLAGRFSYAGPIAAAIAQGLFPSTPEAPRATPVVNFGDYQGRVEWNPGPGKLRVLALGALDEAGTRQNGPNTLTALLTSQFHRVDVAWRQPWKEGQLELGVLLGTPRLLRITFVDEEDTLVSIESLKEVTF